MYSQYFVCEHRSADLVNEHTVTAIQMKSQPQWKAQTDCSAQCWPFMLPYAFTLYIHKHIPIGLQSCTDDSQSDAAIRRRPGDRINAGSPWWWLTPWQRDALWCLTVSQRRACYHGKLPSFVSLQIPPTTHWPSTNRRLLYFLFPNLLSSTSTVNLLPPISFGISVTTISRQISLK